MCERKERSHVWDPYKPYVALIVGHTTRVNCTYNNRSRTVARVGCRANTAIQS
jgi:hypothetical protein